MTGFDMFCLVLVLIAILIGIGGGVHVAYNLAQSSLESNPKPNKKSTTGEFKPHLFGKQATECAHEEAESNVLKNHMLNHDSLSFSEFDCQFSGQDYGAKVIETMQEQEMAYNYLEQVRDK